jgi:hypothetical protein
MEKEVKTTDLEVGIKSIVFVQVETIVEKPKA